jgi:signal transduction histidine kinase
MAMVAGAGVALASLAGGFLGTLVPMQRAHIVFAVLASGLAAAWLAHSLLRQSASLAEQAPDVHADRAPPRNALQHATKAPSGGVGTSTRRMQSELDEIRTRYHDQIQHTARLREKLSGEIRRRTAELVRANRELEKVDRMKDEFISLLAHELRTPLTSVRSYVEILLGYQESVNPEEQRQFLEVIRHQVQRLTRLINELLDLNRIRSGRFELSVEPVMVAPVMQEILDDFQGLARETNHRLELRKTEADLSVRCDRDRLMQILTNLVGNALKYSPPGSHVKLSADVGDEGMVGLAVSDNGPGIPEDEQRSVFEPFYRTRSAGQSNVEGTGLGLYLSRELSRQMGGELSLETADGGGARFVVRLKSGVEARVA